ncbi:hypothetical protein [Dictyoglomus sp.]|uniref:Uncharacterized protein n=1 Tax=Dictyoglomus turgidum (strain DSM 6724 / Z-1310) TaxID=515635 RepID=B8DZC4_DICTD|nr:conserved hypothetical protein [Dictyoglomus turgidum DSM 6724]PNV78697.1 MAG: hypothetical protein C0196_08495 [Dictyoglomus turgidum]HBU31288.1 hypothetical protein [Dictyoglomus sp.]PNV78743.1 MAG: hypothetical protein C0196_08300 [Dictyoglomus turgidum]PNV79709.1 MAG: hypothetical protein C0196_04705 [Dictyoglomus turgidum]
MMGKLFRFIIINFDHFLSKIQGVKIFTDNPECILRYKLVRKKSKTFVELHLWNEHLPQIPSEGIDLFWGKRFQRLFFNSLKELLDFVERSSFSDVEWFMGEIAFFFKNQDKVVRFLKKLGFMVYPIEGRNIFQRFFIFLKNGYSFCLIYAYNPNSLRGKDFFSRKRYQLWIEKDKIRSVYEEAKKVYKT